MKIIDVAIAKLKEKSISEPRIGISPTKKQIKLAETTLDFSFPPSFKRFLKKSGSYLLPFWETYWVGECDREDIVEVNIQERQNKDSPLPKYLIAFFNNGMGDQLCFDTRKKDRNGEYSVVFWDHELTQEENISNLEQVAPSFTDWLMGELVD